MVIIKDTKNVGYYAKDFGKNLRELQLLNGGKLWIKILIKN